MFFNVFFLAEIFGHENAVNPSGSTPVFPTFCHPEVSEKLETIPLRSPNNVAHNSLDSISRFITLVKSWGTGRRLTCSQAGGAPSLMGLVPLKPWT